MQNATQLNAFDAAVLNHLNATPYTAEQLTFACTHDKMFSIECIYGLHFCTKVVGKGMQFVQLGNSDFFVAILGSRVFWEAVVTKNADGTFTMYEAKFTICNEIEKAIAAQAVVVTASAAAAVEPAPIAVESAPIAPAIPTPAKSIKGQPDGTAVVTTADGAVEVLPARTDSAQAQPETPNAQAQWLPMSELPHSPHKQTKLLRFENGATMLLTFAWNGQYMPSLLYQPTHWLQTNDTSRTVGELIAEANAALARTESTAAAEVADPEAAARERRDEAIAFAEERLTERYKAEKAAAQLVCKMDVSPCKFQNLDAALRGIEAAYAAEYKRAHTDAQAQYDADIEKARSRLRAARIAQNRVDEKQATAAAHKESIEAADWVAQGAEQAQAQEPKKIQLTPALLALNEQANKIQDFNKITEAIADLNKLGFADFGYLASCGTTHATQKVFRLWRKAVKLIEKQGFCIKEAAVAQKNAYATTNGGFRQQYKYTIV
jgi:hypothetical protein